MTPTYPAIPISPDVYWVGAIDWDIRDFHGYSTSRGTTYNAFLILAERITLIDTVKRPFFPELMARIASVVPPERIDYIVSNHSEMDHTGCLPEVIEAVRPDKVFTSARGVAALEAHFRRQLPLTVVKDGERVDLGGRHLHFLDTPMLHWPESMIALLEEDGLLFSQDAFGMHLASSERFADQLPDWLLEFEAAKYYANILLPFSPAVGKLLQRVREAGLSFRQIVPDHGPVWRVAPQRIIDLYARWAEQRPTRKAVVTWDTMWGSTEQLARALGEGLAAGGAHPKLMPLGGSHRSDVATELLEAGALAVGTPTLNNQMFPSVADVMSYLRGLKPRHKVGTAFGSYGWGCKGVPQVADILREMGVELIGDPIQVQYVPGEADLSHCHAVGRQIAARLAAAETATG